jgi:hypothetical protein
MMAGTAAGGSVAKIGAACATSAGTAASGSEANAWAGTVRVAVADETRGGGAADEMGDGAAGGMGGGWTVVGGERSGARRDMGWGAEKFLGIRRLQAAVTCETEVTPL